MSEILWKKNLVPDTSLPSEILKDEIFQSEVRETKKYPNESQAILIPDPKAFRSMTRAAILLSNLCMEAKSLIDEAVAKNPFRIGIYCATENGPIDAPTTLKIKEVSQENFAETYRKLRNAKMYLKQLPNLSPAQLGISLGIQGPMNVFTHSRYGSLHALDQAEHDLHQGLVDYALVCTSHAFDDFLVVKRTSLQDSRCLVEGAGALLLKANGKKTDWAERIQEDPNHYYGISHQIICLT